MEKRKICTEDVYDFNYLETPTFSPSGVRVAYCVRSADRERNTYRADVWCCDWDTGKTKQLTNWGNVKFFTWADDQTILVCSLVEEEDKQAVEAGELRSVVYAVDVISGKYEKAFSLACDARQLWKTADNRYLVLAWHNEMRLPAEKFAGKDREQMLLINRQEEAFEVLDEINFWWDGIGYTNKRRNRLYLFSPEEQELHPVTEPLFDVLDAAQTPDGRGVVYAGEVFSSKRRNKHGVYYFDYTLCETKELLPEGKLRINHVACWNDSAIFAATDMKKHGQYQNPDYFIAPLHPQGEGQLKKIASHDVSIWDAVVTDAKYAGAGLCFKAEGDSLYFLTTERRDTRIKCLDRDGCLRDTVAKEGAVNSFDICGTRVAYVGMLRDSLQELFLKDTETGADRVVTEVNRAYMDTHVVAEREQFTMTTPDGTELDGYVLKPVGYVEGKQYPAILDIHGGPPGAYGTVFVHEMQCWAAKGYFVFYTNPRGGDGRGDDFLDIRGKWGDIDYADLMAFTDEVLRRYPMIDVHRLGVTGGSYGGYMTNWIIGHTDRFAAAASQRCVANLTSMVGHSCAGYTFCMEQADADLWEDIEAYWNKSPLRYAKQVKTPTLFIHSEQDMDCFMSEGLQMFTALKIMGTEARLCLFKGESHGLSRTGRPFQRVRRLNEITGWFDRHLLSTEEVQNA